MKINKAVILAWRITNSAYSCFLYLKNSLQEFMQVELWSKTDPAIVDAKYQSGIHNIMDMWFYKVPRIRYFVAQADIYRKAIKEKDTLFIIDDWEFFETFYYVRKENPYIKVVHYCTELPGQDVYVPGFAMRFYAAHADYPDMIIECLEQRGEWRKRQFDISQKIFCINNTLPLDDIMTAWKEKDDALKYLDFSEKHPVLIYAGGSSASRSLDEVIKCIDRFNGVLNFAFFCYGSKEEWEAVNQTFRRNVHGNNYLVHYAVSRSKLLKIMMNCEIGINYYPPEISINHKYSAPTKFFEYMACGLNVVSTDNVGINKIIVENDMGVTIEPEENIGDAIERLMKKGLAPRDKIMNLFAEKYCYEKDSAEAIEHIKSIIGAR